MATINRQTGAILRYALAQGTRDKALRRDLGLSKAAVARSIGISPRSLDRYLKGERRPPAEVHLRMMDAAAELRGELRERFERQAKAEGLPYPSSIVPPRVSRFEMAGTFGGPREKTGIIEVDTEGLEESEFFELLKSWHNSLSREGRPYDIRFLIDVDVAEYFSDDDPLDDDVRGSLKNRKRVPIWIPPRSFIRGREVIRKNLPIFVARPNSDMARAPFEYIYENLKDYLATAVNKYGQSYAGRLGNSGVVKVALIPFRLGGDYGKRKRKRKPRKR